MSHSKLTLRATTSNRNECANAHQHLSFAIAVGVLAASLAAVCVNAASLQSSDVDTAAGVGVAEGPQQDDTPHSRQRRTASWRRVGGSDGYGACSLDGATPVAHFARTEPFVPQNAVNQCKSQCEALSACGAFTIYQATGESPICFLINWSQQRDGDMTSVPDQDGVWRRCFYDADAVADTQSTPTTSTAATTTTVPTCARSERNANLPPHVLILLADDLGVGDLGVQGHPYVVTHVAIFHSICFVSTQPAAPPCTVYWTRKRAKPSHKDTPSGPALHECGSYAHAHKWDGEMPDRTLNWMRALMHATPLCNICLPGPLVIPWYAPLPFTQIHPACIHSKTIEAN